MKKSLKHLIPALFVAAAGSSWAADSGANLEEAFKNPEDVTTSVYWYWVSDNISAEGAAKDLRAMKEQGINRAFIGNIGLSDAPNDTPVGNVKFQSEEWWNAIHTALKTATEIGVEIGIFNSPGWSQSGGPWVQPGQSMRYLKSLRADVEGGKQVDITIPAPKDFQDVKVVAYPSMSVQEKLITPDNATIKTTPAYDNPQVLLDGSKDSQLNLGVLNNEDVVFDVTTKEPFTLRSLTISIAATPINCMGKLYAAVDGKETLLSTFKVNRYNFGVGVGFEPLAPIVISVPATTSNNFKLVFEKVQNHGVMVSDLKFSSLPYVERYAEKTLAKMFQEPLPMWDEYLWPEQPKVNDPALVIQPQSVIDISDYRDGDRIVWDAPDGNWTILRTGMLPTGAQNGPARPPAVGLETDKMSKKHIEAHFENYMGEFIRRIPEADRKAWKVVVQDSYETGGQNFTDDFMNIFADRYGYEMTPFLPVFSGQVVGSEDFSDRFLWDLRRLIADKVSYDYVGGLRDVSHKYGLTTWLECYGHWGFPGEFLQYGGQSDEIAGEFWSEGSLGDIENRAASSCGHIYGKTKISAESFTSGFKEYQRYPYLYKQRGDRFFSEGINNTLLHLYLHQPYEDKNPGINAWFGNEFNRKNTWFSHMGLFSDYLKRVNLMLQQGLNVADVAYFIGEDAPKMTGATNPPLPKGYQFDYMNGEVLEKNMTVKDRKLTLPHGTQYRMMVLPPLDTMRPEILKKIKELVEDGGIVMGNPPSRSPSFENYPDCDQEVQEIASEMWEGLDGTTTKSKKIGKGFLLRGMTMQEALDFIKCPPDVKIEEYEPVLYGHRTTDDAEIYFISNQSETDMVFAPEFRVTGKQPEHWDAVHGTMRDLKSFKFTKTGTIVPLKLAPLESAFIVFRKDAEGDTQLDVEANFPEMKTITEVTGPWTATFTGMKAPKPLVMDKLLDLTAISDFDTRHFSGRINYESKFNLTDTKGPIFVDLGQFGVMAKVKVNGKYAGGAWTPPYRVDITDFVKSGENKIEVDVATTWRNRIIGDLNLPENEREISVSVFDGNKDSPLQPSGLTGPVLIQTTAQ